MTEAQANFKSLFPAFSGFENLLENEYVYMTVYATSNCKVNPFVMQPIPNPLLLCPL